MALSGTRKAGHWSWGRKKQDKKRCFVRPGFLSLKGADSNFRRKFMQAKFKKLTFCL
jgi:hypothetical protein